MAQQLKKDLDQLTVVGQISTIGGEEIVCTTDNHEQFSQISKLTSAFIDTDQLTKSLKLGDLKQVVACGSLDSKCVVQSKVKNDQDQNEDIGSNAKEILITSVVSESLSNAFVADEIIRETGSQILQR